MIETYQITFNIPRELQGNEGKLREHLESREEYIAKKLNCFGASFKDIIIQSNNRYCATYNLIHTEDWQLKLDIGFRGYKTIIRQRGAKLQKVYFIKKITS